ncbi:MAG: Aromatic-ring-opening dioxygenase LigAB, LigA subunit [Chloroflexi bacterium]|jgi:hypothetical protein|nr:MAG: Aromatic-ring-opening dioxygenase LigAB, LigA subunit [Chloroflexota bacterium]
MSLYQTNKAVKLLPHNNDTEPLRRFKEEPEEYLKGFDLTDEERQGLMDRNYAKLYSMGVQPFILQTFACKLANEPLIEFMPKYTALLKDLGSPSYET